VAQKSSNVKFDGQQIMKARSPAGMPFQVKKEN
jgi:hypothetical protein